MKNGIQLLLTLLFCSNFVLAQQTEVIVQQPQKTKKADINKAHIDSKYAEKKVVLIPAPNFKEKIPSRPGFTEEVWYRIFKYKDLKKSDVKGIVLLSSYSGGIDGPSVAFLDSIAQPLANENFIVAIIGHYGFDSGDYEAGVLNFNEHYANVWDHITKLYGGTIDKTVLGGQSFSGMNLSYILTKPEITWLNGIKGIVLIAAGSNPWSSVPIINKVCTDDIDSKANGNFCGNELQTILNTNVPAIAAKSVCETDNTCTGHTTEVYWAKFFVENIRKWFK